MKKITSIFLLGLLLYNMVGYFLVYETQSYLEKNELYNGMSMTVPVETIVSFKIPLTGYPQPNQELEISKDDFAYNGKYYEMSRQWIETDTLHIEAFEDAKHEMLEQSLYAHVQEHIIDANKALPTGKTPLEKSKKLFSNLLKDYLPETKISFNFGQKKLVSSEKYFPSILPITPRYLEISSPPPQEIC